MKEESIEKYKNIFWKNGETLFNDKEFLKTSDLDKTKVFEVEIQFRDDFFSQFVKDFMGVAIL